MQSQGHLCTELQAILSEFTRFRNAYMALKKYCETQDEVLGLKKQELKKVKEELDRATRSSLAHEKRHRFVVEGLQKERDDLRRAMTELQEQRDHLRLINSDRNAAEDQICRLQDELEVSKARLILQEEKYLEDLAILKKNHADEIEKYKMLLDSSKQKNRREKETRGRGASRQTGSRNVSRGASKIASKSSSFRWPNLQVERISCTPVTENEEATQGGSKRRKLYHEDRDATVDLI